MPSANAVLKASWKAEETQAFSGWDFSHIAGRMIEDEPPWDYMATAAVHLKSATSALDMDTGGGERLLELRSFWPRSVAATEGYAPNLLLARQRLEPFGVRVVEMESGSQATAPFESGSFDLVLNRHGAFNAPEVARILRPGGIFLSQQVHGLWANDLLAHFSAQPRWLDATFENAVERLAEAGLEMEGGQDWQGHFAFSDVAALVYYLRALPWLVPDFSVERHFDRLLSLQDRVEADGKLVFEKKLYWFKARKPG